LDWGAFENINPDAGLFYNAMVGRKKHFDGLATSPKKGFDELGLSLSTFQIA